MRGVELVVQERARERAAAVSSLAQAAVHVGEELLPGGPSDDRPLAIDTDAAAFLGDWFGFATSVLEQLRADVRDGQEPSRVQLWPEHFDVSVELGLELEGRRAAYGASPGDERHAEPYLYVTPSSAVRPGRLWNASAFAGAELPYDELLRLAGGEGSGAAQRELALAFLRERLHAMRW